MSDYFQIVCDTFKNPFYHDWALQVVTVAMHYPLDFVQTLIQIGYEPRPPLPGKLLNSTFIENVKTQVFQLQPNTEYLKYIKSVDGYGGCYRGFFPYMCGNSICYLVTTSLSKYSPFDAVLNDVNVQRVRLRIHNQMEHALRFAMNIARGGGDGDGRPYMNNDNQEEAEEDADNEKLYFLKETWWKLVCSNVGIIASHPFYVIAVRSMAQFVGRESKYNCVCGGIAEIFRTEGIRGFFKGIVPKLLAESNYVLLTSVIVFAVKKIFNNNIRSQDFSSLWVKVLAEAASHMYAGSYIHPFLVVTDTMIVNNTGLAIGSSPYTATYPAWGDAYKALTLTNQISRGLKRTYPGPFSIVDGKLSPSFPFGPLHPPGFGFLNK